MTYSAASAASKDLAQNPKRASSLAPRCTSPEFLLSFGAALRGLCAFNGMLKKAIGPPLPHGRGPVSVCKRVTAFVSRTRQHAVFGPFRLPFGPAARGGVFALLLTSALIGANLPGNYFTGQGGRMIIGQATFTDAMPGTSERLLGSVGGVAYAADTLFIADSSRFTGITPQNRRVLIYHRVSTKFPSPKDAIGVDVSRCPVCTGRNDFPYPADVVLGQKDFVSSDIAISQTGMRLPTAVASDGRILAVADTENNRVLIWNSIPTSIGQPADIVLGQSDFNSIQQPIVVTASSFRGPQGVWIQNGRFFVADTQNHRVLIWRTIPAKNNQAADVVLGQGNFTTAPEPDLTKLATSATATALLNPVSVTSDGNRLYVTDLGFQRVLIWNRIPDANQAPADVVVGEPDMTSFAEGGNDSSKICASSGPDSSGKATYPAMCEKTLSFPRFALSDGQRLYIADGGNDRVLIFKSIPTQNGAAADVVLGQRDFYSDPVTDNSGLFTPNLQRSSADTIRTPTSLAWDGQNLYVADPYDRRILVFTPAEPTIPFDGVRNAASLEVFAIGSIDFTANPAVNDQVTITIGVSSANTKDYVYKAVKNDLIAQVIAGLVAAINANAGDPNVFAIANPAFNNITLTAKVAGPDGDNITVTDTLSANAILALTATNPTGGQDAATIAPGTLVTIAGSYLAAQTVSAPANTPTLPRDLGGVQVYFDGIRAPLTFVSPTQINAQVPYEILDATSITSWVRTVQADGTVTITSAVAIPITPQNPGIFAKYGQDPRVAVAFHASSSATVSILVDGTITAGNTATITIEDRQYNYTVQSSDKLADVRDNLITKINSAPNEKVTAAAGGSFARIILTAKDPGAGGNNITVSTSTSSTATLTLSASNSNLCCANLAGAPITPENPAVAGEMIYVWATGLGLVTPDSARAGLHTGQAYDGPALNDAASSTSSLAGARTANLISASAVIGTIGLYKVVLELNSGLATNPVTQMTIAQNIYVSNTVSIPVVNPSQ
jgi:uncharacterized protein (TIGR03437 family)